MSFVALPADQAKPARAIAPAGHWERVGAAVCLAQCSEPFFAALAQSQGLTEVPGYARIAWAPVALFLIWAMRRDWPAFGGALSRTPVLLTLFGLALISTMWSIDPGASFRRATWLMLTMSFGFYLAGRYRWRDLLEIAATSWIFLIVGSAVIAIAAPAIGVMAVEHPGAWSGLWTHKNTLGGFMALGVAIGCAAFLATQKKIWLGVAFASFLLVLMSTSKTALLASFLQIAVMMFSMIARRGPMHALIVMTLAAAGAIIGATLMLTAPELIVTAIGRDLTFTGRTDIWGAVEHALEARPWFGYGYSVFWLDDAGPAYAVRTAVNWEVPSAHNGWLELALSIGWIGVALFVVQLIATTLRALGALARSPAGIWAPAFLAAFALYTMSESHILEANNLFWTLYVCAAARLALDARESDKSA
ncbi:MAG: O-antigen ligase family protein [Caulobacterales bacterium]